MKEEQLSNIPLGKKVVVTKLLSEGSIRRRLLDIGLSPGTIVYASLKNPGGNLIAYMIRGALIAIRNDDAQNILVKEYGGCNS